ncbi:MAG: hypothetical protein K0R27_322 [Xanthobacteraceae bacterium]|jgi:hypothetical protein|nr:hypothetical protein [Xanthobacteraceae bacterium]
MKIIVHQVDGAWVRFPGTPQLDPAVILGLLADGIWGTDDLAEHGLAVGDEPDPEPEPSPPPRRRLPKSLVQDRLIAAGKLDAAYAALTAHPASFARWFAPDHPEVYADDPDALELLAAIGADAAQVMAE